MEYQITDLMVNLNPQEEIQGCTAATCTCTKTGYSPEMTSKESESMRELENLKNELKRSLTN